MCSEWVTSSAREEAPEQTRRIFTSGTMRFSFTGLLKEDRLFTFIEPVSDPVEDDPFLPRGRQPEGVTLNVRLVVDVVFKYVDLRNADVKVA